MTQRQPIFRTVTGRDFGRSIRWARQHPRRLVALIAAAQLRTDRRAAR
jgi:hypothetical protein